MKLMNNTLRTTPVLLGLCCLLIVGCAAPQFHPVSSIPAGRALVYVYAPNDCVAAPSMVWLNGEKLGRLGPEQYYVHYPEPGTNIYSFRPGFSARGGLIGLLVTHEQPGQTLVRMQPGKTYYLKLVGAGLGASLWREEESAALPDLRKCRPVEVEPAKRLAVKVR